MKNNNKDKFEKLIEKACNVYSYNKFKEDIKEEEKIEEKNKRWLLHKIYKSNKLFTNLLLKWLVY